MNESRIQDILIPLLGERVAPRFDLATEVLIARVEGGKLSGEPRVVILTGPSADELCSLILKENIHQVLCGGIEDSHFQYLSWKKVRVVDRLIGNWQDVLRLQLAGSLQAGMIVRDGHPIRHRP